MLIYFKQSSLDVMVRPRKYLNLGKSWGHPHTRVRCWKPRKKSSAPTCSSGLLFFFFLLSVGSESRSLLLWIVLGHCIQGLKRSNSSAVGSLKGEPCAFYSEITPGLLAGLKLAAAQAGRPVTTGCTQLVIWASFACLLRR